jgi:hypothetical protein
MTTATKQIIKIEQLPGKTVVIYALAGIKEVIRLGVLDDQDIAALPMTRLARKYWDNWIRTKQGVTIWDFPKA